MTIAAMKQALAALEQAETNCNFVCYKAKNDLRAAIAEQEKAEPVAEVVDAGGVFHFPKLQWKSANHSLETPIGSQLFTHPASVPAGWQLVPVEPTPEMIRASWDLASVGMFPDGTKHYISIAYKAMLTAAPKPGEMK